MESSSKGPLIIEAPPGYSASPKLPGLPCKKILIVVVVIVVIVLVVLGFLLMGLSITEKHTEAVLQMTIQGSKQHLTMSRKEKMATFHVSLVNSSATVVYDYSNLLIAFRRWPGHSCYVLRMNKENIQSLDAAVRVFQHIKETKHPTTLLRKSEEGAEGLRAPLVDRTVLGTTINILCSAVPTYWV